MITREELIRYVDGDLSPQRKLQIEDHLTRDPDAMTFVQALNEMDKNLSQPEIVAGSLEDQVWNAVSAKETSPVSSIRINFSLLVGLFAFMVLLISLLIYSQEILAFGNTAFGNYQLNLSPYAEVLRLSLICCTGILGLLLLDKWLTVRVKKWSIFSS